MLTLLLIIIPLVFTIVLFALPDSKYVKSVALIGGIVEFVFSLYVLFQYQYGCHCVLNYHSQFFQQLGISFSLNIDGLSLLMILLTSFLSPLIIYSAFTKQSNKPPAFYALILLMETAFIGVFTATDVLWFYVFWDLALIPICFLTAVWGGKNKRVITVEFLIYTLVGSLLMLIAIIYLYTLTPGMHSFSFSSYYNLTLDYKTQVWVCLAFFMAFAIKVPLFPFHSWLPKTHTASPTQGSMFLAGIMLKMGIYGLLRFIIPLCPLALGSWTFYAVVLSVVGILYSSIIAIKQTELKRLIAFSSLGHMGLIAAGVFSLTFNGIEGGILQVISHGINVAGMFFCYDIIYRRTKTGTIASIGGIASKAPIFSVFFMIILLANIALPLTNGFVGEFLLLMGIFEYNAYLSAIAGLTIIFGAIYMLWMYQRIMYGETTEATQDFPEITLQESLVLTPLVIMIFWIGIYPKMFLHIAEPYVRDLLEVLTYKLK